MSMPDMTTPMPQCLLLPSGKYGDEIKVSATAHEIYLTDGDAMLALDVGQVKQLIITLQTWLGEMR